MTSEYVERQRWAAAHAAELVELERKRPFMLLRPNVFLDGDKWCALYGENLMRGVAGFGDTPEAAARQFDIEWLNATSSPSISASRISPGDSNGRT